MTLQDLLDAAGASSAQGPAQTVDDRTAYLNYTMACMEAGKKPLPYPDWVKAGKPAQ